MPRAVISVDRRANGEFASNAHRAFPLLDAFSEAEWDVGLLNINRALPELEQAARTGVVFVLADTFASGSPGAERWRAPHGFREWLERLSVPFVGSGYAGMRRSSSCDKAASRRALAEAGVPVPPGLAMSRCDTVDTTRVAAELPGPLVVKQATATGVGVGVHLAHTTDELAELIDWHHRVRRHDTIVERFIDGREFSGWVIEQGGIPGCYELVEIRKPATMPILDQDAKLRARLVGAFSTHPDAPETLPGPALPEPLRRQLADTVVAAHAACGLRHYSRVDLILHDGVPFVLDVNAAPEIADAGLGSVAEARGETLADVVARLAHEALR